MWMQTANNTWSYILNYLFLSKESALKVLQAIPLHFFLFPYLYPFFFFFSPKNFWVQESGKWWRNQSAQQK